MIKGKENRRAMRHGRFVKRLPTGGNRPRLLVRKSLKHISAILIDDRERRVITSVTSYSPAVADALRERKEGEARKAACARLVGELIARAALEKGHAEVIFDRGGCAYHGRVKLLAESARATGLKF